MKVVVSLDVDGTMEFGEPPGPVTVEIVELLLAAGHIVGCASDRTRSDQEQTWERAGLALAFVGGKHHLDTVRERGLVPRVYLATLPPDLPNMPDTDERKLAFIKMVLPLVLHVNETIAQDRTRIVSLHHQFTRTKALDERDADWLHNIATAYGLDQDADFDELLRRVDVVPTSLAVAQAAIESG